VHGHATGESDSVRAVPLRTYLPLRARFEQQTGQTLSNGFSSVGPLTRYYDDGRIEIDHNAAERALRAVALGHKNYRFVGSDTDGEHAAAINNRGYGETQRPEPTSLFGPRAGAHR